MIRQASSAPHRTHLLGATLLLVTIAWVPLIDRQDLVKLTVWALATLVLVASAFAAGKRADFRVGFVGAILAGFLIFLPSARAGFEAWLVIWLAVLTWWLARSVSPERLSAWVVAAACLQAVLALSTFWIDPFHFAEYVVFRGRAAVGTFGNPTLLGVWLAAMLPVGLVWRSRWRWVPLVLIASGVFASQSRVALVLLVLGGIGIVALLRPWGSRKEWFILGGVLGSCGLAIWMVYRLNALDPGPWVERMHVILTVLEGMSAAPVSRWLFGMGPEAFALHWPLWRSLHAPQSIVALSLQHAHTDALEWTIEFGAFGLALWITLTFRCLRVLRDGGARARLAALSLSLLLLASLVQPTLVTSPGAVLASALLAIMTPASPGPSGRFRRRAVLLMVGVVLAIVIAVAALRVVSEALRCEATLLRLAKQPSLESALRAAEWDETNDRAWLEVMMAQDADAPIRSAASKNLRIQGGASLVHAPQSKPTTNR